MPIPNSDHLLDQATRLIAPTASGVPRQADLRRAISTAYYGLFHAVCAAAADEFVGTGQRTSGRYSLVYRRVEHVRFWTCARRCWASDCRPDWRRMSEDTSSGPTSGRWPTRSRSFSRSATRPITILWRGTPARTLVSRLILRGAPCRISPEPPVPTGFGFSLCSSARRGKLHLHSSGIGVYAAASLPGWWHPLRLCPLLGRLQP
jgi:hypothetical protein